MASLNIKRIERDIENDKLTRIRSNMNLALRTDLEEEEASFGLKDFSVDKNSQIISTGEQEDKEKADLIKTLSKYYTFIKSEDLLKSLEKEQKKENSSELHQHIPKADNPELEKQRLQFFRQNPTQEKASIFNVLTSCKIKVGQAKDTDFSSKVPYRKNNISSIINNYNRIRSALQNGTMNPIDINFIDTPSAINRENYLKIKPYIQLIELYKLSKSNNLKAVSFFETSVNDDAFSSYPDSIKNAFWLQGFNIYYELNHKDVAYYLLNQVEKNYAGKPQYMYNNAILSKLLSDLFLESDYPEFADEHLSKYVSVIEQFPQEQLNYIDNLLELSENEGGVWARKDYIDLIFPSIELALEGRCKIESDIRFLAHEIENYEKASEQETIEIS